MVVFVGKIIFKCSDNINDDGSNYITFSLAKTPRQRLEAWKPPRAVYELLVSL